MGWCWFFKLEYTKALPFFARLEAENSWSKGFYIYMQGVVAMEEGKWDEALKLCEKVAALLCCSGFNNLVCAQVNPVCQRKYGGKTISIEQFVLRRANALVKACSACCCQFIWLLLFLRTPRRGRCCQV